VKTKGCLLLIVCLVIPSVLSVFHLTRHETGIAQAADSDSPTLEFNQTSGEKEIIQPVETAKKNPLTPIWLILSFAVYLFIIGIIFLYVRRNQHILPHASIRLMAFPPSAKVLITLVLLMFSLVHVFGLWDAYLQTHSVFDSAEEYFSYMKLTKLISLSHPHLFGFALMYLLVGSLFILTSWSEPVKSFILTIPILSAVFDVLSWWMIKMVSADFELLTIFTGITFSLGFGTMTLLILYEMWLMKQRKGAFL
jgi:hypothetical protein